MKKKSSSQKKPSDKVKLPKALDKMLKEAASATKTSPKPADMPIRNAPSMRGAQRPPIRPRMGALSPATAPAPAPPIPPEMMAEPRAFKKGGEVKKTGMALVHKGEKVLTKSQQKKYSGKK